MIQSGCGLNFGLPLGILSGLLGATLSIEFNAEILNWLIIFSRGLNFNEDFIMLHHEAVIFSSAFFIAVPIAIISGWLYGILLNTVKGSEMMISIYIGFSAVSFMCMAWLLIPYKNPVMMLGYSGKGLRSTISVENFWLHVLNDSLSININEGLYIPTGMLIFFMIIALLLWLFTKTKTGTEILIAGSNPDYARASGVNVNHMRIISVIISNVLAAVGILVYEQSFGFIQLYNAPFLMALPAAASILIGGASVNKANIFNAVIGTFLFQSILTMTPLIINSAVQSDISDVIRIIISNGIILYALTRKK